jgi:hypothetical protein
MKKLNYLMLINIVIFFIECASQYKLPEANEPFAMVKTKMTIDVDKAKQFLPQDKLNEAIIMALSVSEAKGEQRIKAGEIPGMIAMKGHQSQTESFKVHPGRPTTISVMMGIQWQTNRLEDVEKIRKKPVQVTKQEYERVSEYDYYSKQNKYVSKLVTKTVTEYQDEKYKVSEHVLKTGNSSCHVDFTFLPEKDSVYMFDYTNSLVDSACSVQLYKQTPLNDGKFKLTPVEQYINPVKK